MEDKKIIWFLTKYNTRRMEHGNISLLAAAVLPLVNFAFLTHISWLAMAGLILYELLLVIGVALGTKQYQRAYYVQNRIYDYGPHTPIRWLIGFSAAGFVFAPTKGIVVVLLWIIAIPISVLINYCRGQRKDLWNEYLMEYATAIRAGYFCYIVVCLVVCLIVSIIL